VSARKNIMDALVFYAKAVRNKRYHVKRGAIAWEDHDFDGREFAIAVMVDDCTILNPRGMNEAKIGIEIATKMPGTTEDPQIDDGTLDLLIEDAEFILENTKRKQDSQGDNVLLKLTGANVTEFHDAAIRVQGIVVSFNST
jgi:hypothetical protein